MSIEQERAALTDHLESLGREAARRVMLTSTTEMLEVDAMTALVEAECRDLRTALENGSVAPVDIQRALDVFKLALVREGKRITMAVEFEGGTA